MIFPIHEHHLDSETLSKVPGNSTAAPHQITEIDVVITPETIKHLFIKSYF